MVTMNQQKRDSDMQARVGRLEGAMESLAHEMETTNRSVKELVMTVGSFKEDMLKTLAAINNPKPNWPLIVGLGSLILTIIGIGGLFTYNTMSGVRDIINVNTIAIAQLKDEIGKTKYEEGKQSEWRIGVDNSIVRLDSSLQREMRLINDTTETKIKSLDEKLQSETKGINETLKKEVEGLISNVTDLRTWRLSHAEQYATIDGENKARFDSLEKDIALIKDKFISTSNTNWSKADQEHYDTILNDKLREIRDRLYTHLTSELAKK
jgi:hypothetical protein